MSDIFREVDEELKQERYARLWQKYGRYVIAFFVLLVLAVAGREGWHHYRDGVRQDESDRFFAATRAITDSSRADALAAYETLADDAATGYGLLARFRAASLRFAEGDQAGGLAGYEAIAADGAVPAIYQELAVLLIALNSLDSADPASLEARLQPLVAAGRPWRHTARELLAALALRQTNSDAAISLYRQLADDGEAPQGARARAAEMLRIIDGGG